MMYMIVPVNLLWDSVNFVSCLNWTKQQEIDTE